MKKIAEFIAIVILMGGIVAGAIEFGQVGSFDSLANLTNVFTGLEWFLGSFVVASLFTAYLVVIAPTKVFLRFLAIPAWLIFSISLLITVDQFMGYSYPAIPPQATVMSFYVYKTPENVKMIEAWMYFKDEGRTRAYKFPHTLQREKALSMGQAGARKGEPVEVDLGKGVGRPDGQIPESMIIYDWNLDATYPSKQQNPEDAPTMLPEDGNIYQFNPDGEIEVIDPERTEMSIEDWMDPVYNLNTSPVDYGDHEHNRALRR